MQQFSLGSPQPPAPVPAPAQLVSPRPRTVLALQDWSALRFDPAVDQLAAALADPGPREIDGDSHRTSWPLGRQFAATWAPRGGGGGTFGTLLMFSGLSTVLMPPPPPVLSCAPGSRLGSACAALCRGVSGAAGGADTPCTSYCSNGGQCDSKYSAVFGAIDCRPCGAADSKPQEAPLHQRRHFKKVLLHDFYRLEVKEGNGALSSRLVQSTKLNPGHQYRSPTTGGEASASEAPLMPGPRLMAATWTGNDSRAWLFGGIGSHAAPRGYYEQDGSLWYDAVGSLCDLWAYDIDSGSGSSWRRIGACSAGTGGLANAQPVEVSQLPESWDATGKRRWAAPLAGRHLRDAFENIGVGGSGWPRVGIAATAWTSAHGAAGTLWLFGGAGCLPLEDGSGATQCDLSMQATMQANAKGGGTGGAAELVQLRSGLSLYCTDDLWSFDIATAKWHQFDESRRARQAIDATPPTWPTRQCGALVQPHLLATSRAGGGSLWSDTNSSGFVTDRWTAADLGMSSVTFEQMAATERNGMPYYGIHPDAMDVDPSTCCTPGCSHSQAQADRRPNSPVCCYATCGNDGGPIRPSRPAQSPSTTHPLQLTLSSGWRWPSASVGVTGLDGVYDTYADSEGPQDGDAPPSTKPPLGMQLFAQLPNGTDGGGARRGGAGDGGGGAGGGGG